MEETAGLEGELAPVDGVFDAFEELGEDYIYCAHAIEADPKSQFWRRTMIHTLFALTEVTTYAIKQFLLHKYSLREIELSSPEIAILREENYVLKNNGKVSTEKAKLRTADNFKFALSLFIEKTGAAHPLAFNGGEWEAYKKSLKIRDRITHPKSFSDVIVTDSEYDVLRESINFIGQSYVTTIPVIMKQHLISEQ